MVFCRAPDRTTRTPKPRPPQRPPPPALWQARPGRYHPEEADRLVDFTRFFTHAGPNEVRSLHALRPPPAVDPLPQGPTPGARGWPTPMSATAFTHGSLPVKPSFSREALRLAQAAWSRNPGAAPSAPLGRRARLRVGWQAVSALAAESHDRMALVLQRVRHLRVLACGDQGRVHLRATVLLLLRSGRHVFRA